MTTVAVEAQKGGAGEAGTARVSRRRFRAGPWLAAAPFLLVVAVGLLAPTIALAVAAFQRTDQDSGATVYTVDNVTTAFGGGYRTALTGSLKLAVLTAVIGGVVGVVLAYAIQVGGSTWMRRLVTTASGVAANFGGIPLAFA